MSFSPGPTSLAGQHTVQEQRDRWERKRNRIARELVQTEQRYVEQLELVITYFVEILKAKGTLRQDIRESIFSSIKSIHSLNQTLLVHLENGYYSRGFEQACPRLQHYVTYVDNFQNARKVLGMQLKKNKAFRRFKKLQEARPEFQDYKLEELLPLPLQRIQQYTHFLRDLTENTSPDNPEFQPLSKALKAFSEVSQRIQDNARRHENDLQLRRVQRLLKGRKTKVSAPGRWYVREGWLHAVTPKGKEAKPKMFFLFSDMLLQATRCGPLHSAAGASFVGQHAYPLRDCAVDKVFGHTKSQGGLLSLTFPKAKVLLMSNDQEDFNDWYQSLSSAVGKLRSRTTVLHSRDELCRSPLRPTADPQQTPSTASHVSPGRKRNVVSIETSDYSYSPSSPWPVFSEPDGSASKRMKLSQPAAESAAEPSGFSCAIL